MIIVDFLLDLAPDGCPDSWRPMLDKTYNPRHVPAIMTQVVYDQDLPGEVIGVGVESFVPWAWSREHGDYWQEWCRSVTWWF